MSPRSPVMESLMNFYIIWLEHKAKSPSWSRRKSGAFIATEFIIFLFLFLWRQLFLLRLIHRPKADDLVIFVFCLLFAFPRLPIKNIQPGPGRLPLHNVLIMKILVDKKILGIGWMEPLELKAGKKLTLLEIFSVTLWQSYEFVSYTI